MKNLRRRRLYCRACGARKSEVVYDKEKKKPVATCDKKRGGCGAEIPLYKDEYDKWHPVRTEN